MPRTRRVLRWATVACAVWLGGACLAAHLVSRRPTAPYEEPLPDVPWATATPIVLQAEDGATVKGYGLNVRTGAPTVVLLHMNRADRGAMLPAAEAWARLGFNSVAITLRSHGDAEGGRLDFGRTARLDAAAAVKWVRDRGDGEILVHGVSLGSAAALFASKELSGQVAGYVFEAPYTDVVDATYNRTSIFLPPILDQIAGWSLLAVAPWFVPGVRAISPLVAAQDLDPSAPVLILVGERDRYSTPEQMERYRSVLGARATFVTADVGHTEWLQDVPLMVQTFSNWRQAVQATR